MVDHVVGHFSSSVGPRRRDWGAIPAGRPLVLPDMAQMAATWDSPVRLCRLRAPTDPADWRFREDGY